MEESLESFARSITEETLQIESPFSDIDVSTPRIPDDSHVIAYCTVAQPVLDEPSLPPQDSSTTPRMQAENGPPIDCATRHFGIHAGETLSHSDVADKELKSSGEAVQKYIRKHLGSRQVNSIHLYLSSHCLFNKAFIKKMEEN